MEFLGRVVSEDALKMACHDKEAVKEWPIPKKSKEVERFTGLANYHRTAVKDFSKLAEPLYRITGKRKFVWGLEQEVAIYPFPNRDIRPISSLTYSNHMIRNT